jgi:hypothetical protein
MTERRPRSSAARRQLSPRMPAGRVGDTDMDDERITWTSCPRCSDRAAVGWRITKRGDTVKEDPVSFDCTAGCTLTASQVRSWFSGRRA